MGIDVQFVHIMMGVPKLKEIYIQCAVLYLDNPENLHYGVNCLDVFNQVREYMIDNLKITLPTMDELMTGMK